MDTGRVPGYRDHDQRHVRCEGSNNLERVSIHLSENITGSSQEESFATPGNVMLTRVFVIAAKTRIKDGVSHEWNIRDPQTPTVTHWPGFLFSNIL